MNNAFIIADDVLQNEESDSSPKIRQEIEQLSEVIEALQNIADSSYWKVLRKYVFDVYLDKAKRSVATEKDTTEIFRLQGEIRFAERLNLEELIVKYRNNLEKNKQKINE